MRLILGWAILSLITVVGLQADPKPDVPASSAPANSEGPSVDSPGAASSGAVSPVPTPAPVTEHFVLDPKFRVTKVHIVDNTETYKDGGNHALEFEPKYWNYGAVTKEEKEARRGQIYVVSWENSGATENLTARFEYRQVNTKDAVSIKTINFPDAAGTKRATFEVVGPEYRKNGAVYSWRFTILRGDQVVALERSYIW